MLISLLLQIAGGCLVLLVLTDVFMTVLYVRSSAGLITPRLNRLLWLSFRALAPQERHARDYVLSFAGPVIIVVTAAVWVSLLVLGFALIIWPALGHSVQTSSGVTPTDFTAAIYYSGYSLTTLGTGDIVPQTPLFRMIMVAEAIVGFSVFTLTLTYFMSVYAALVRRNTLAQGLHHMTGGTGDAAELICRLGPGGSFEDARSLLSNAAMGVLDLLESHHAYPVIHLFRLREPTYAMSRVALITMDTATLLRSGLGDRHRALSQSAGVELLWGSGLTLLKQTGASFLPEDAADERPRDRGTDELHLRFSQAIDRISQCGIEIAGDMNEARSKYLELRNEWDGPTRAFARLMAYEWSEIEVSRTPQQKQEPS